MDMALKPVGSGFHKVKPPKSSYKLVNINPMNTIDISPTKIIVKLELCEPQLNAIPNWGTTLPGSSNHIKRWGIADPIFRDHSEESLEPNSSRFFGPRNAQHVTGWWLSPTPLKNMSLSVGMMTFPTEWKNKKCSKPPTRLRKDI